jgi:FkbM family methyltransferase
MRKIKLKAKFILKVILGKELFTKVQKKYPSIWYGNPNAGFYISTEHLNKDSTIYSFGLGEDISAEEKLILSFGSTVYGFDPTPKTKEFLERKGVLQNFVFLNYGLYNYNGTIKFYLPEDSKYVSGTTFNRWNYDEAEIKPIEVPVKKFSTIVKELNHTKIDILKMDIEGSEYEVLDDIMNAKVEIKQILIEFHHRFKEIGLGKTRDAIKKLNENGYKIAAISESREEYTFIKS